MKKHLVIIGAGGLGRIIHDSLSRHPVVMAQYALAGFLDTRADLQLPESIAVPILGNPLQYQIGRKQAFIPAVGNPALKESLVTPIAAQGAEFASFYNREFVGARTEIGHGTFLAAGSMVSVDCRVGEYVFIDSHTIIGHDVEIGDYCMIGAQCFLAGGARLGKGVTVHPHASIGKDVEVGEGATIGLGAVVVKDVAAGATVFGNPARVIYSQTA